MAQVNESDTITLVGLIVSALATAETLAKLLIEKGLITETELIEKLNDDRAAYQEILSENG
jgi:hypothetical protein